MSVPVCHKITLYDFIGLPLSNGAFHVSITCPFPGVAIKSEIASGGED